MTVTLQSAENFRVVSLLPSATEIIAAIGCGHLLVGRSHECDYPEWVSRLPVCSTSRIDVSKPSDQIDRDVKGLLKNALSIFEVDAEALAELRPTHIVTQTQCEVCAVSPQDVDAALCEITRLEPTIISVEPKRFQQIFADVRTIGKALGSESTAKSLNLELAEKIAQVYSQATFQDTRPTVGCIEWIEPLMSAGNWVPDLVELAGGDDVLATVGEHSPWLSWEKLQSADPEILIVMPCGFSIERTEQEFHLLESHSEWPNLKAVRENKVFITDGNQLFNRPGPRVLESVEVLAEIIHPEVFEPRNSELWRRVENCNG
ncbi:MAG: cobalamin-binding protein [Planctomycetaceae bacterium]|nr:cobalamin-binding protein [Planctomycetaceae bacterium]